MPKRNREKLMEQSMYDLLCKINDGMKENWQWKPCIMSALGFDFFERADRCRKYGEAENKRCGDCIADYLNEYPF
jgi:hypothetical protein